MLQGYSDTPAICVEQFKDGNRLVFGDYVFRGIPSWIISSERKKHILLARKFPAGTLLFVDEQKLPALLSFCEKVRARTL